MAEPSRPEQRHGARPRWVLPALLTAIGVLVVMNTTGNIAYSALVRRHPAVLIALNASNKSLIGATTSLDALSFYGIGAVRLLVADPLFYVLGVLYGDAAIRWAERKLGDGASIYLWFEKLFKKARYPMVAIAPNNLICLLAGATGMSAPVFFGLNLFGTVTRLVLIRLLGEAFETPIEAVTGFLDRYRWPLLGVSAALFLLQGALRRQQGDKGELGDLLQLKDELEGDGTAAATDDPAAGGAAEPAPDRPPEPDLR